MASHRYWRIWCVGTNHGYFSFAEIEFALTTGGADITGSGTATAKDSWSDSYGPALAVDNSNSSWWYSRTGSGTWWQYDFLTAQDIAEIRMRAPTGTNAIMAPNAFTVQGSDDGVTWISYELFLNLSWTAGELKTFAIGSTALPTGVSNARVWRLSFPDAINGQYLIIDEIEMRASMGGADLCTGGTPGGSGSWDTNGGYGPQFAFNNSTAGLFSASSDTARAPKPYSLLYVFPSATPTVRELLIRVDESSGAYGPTAVTLSWSNDGVTFTDYFTTWFNSWANGQSRTIFVSDTVLTKDADLKWPISAGERLLADAYLRWQMVVPLFNELQAVWPLGRQATVPSRIITAVNEQPELGWYVPREWVLTASETRPVLGFGAGAYTLPIAISPPPNGVVSLNRQFTGDFYFRIWIIPDTIRLQNPTIGAPIPFQIWSAYPYDNTLQDITYSGTGGVAANITLPFTFGPVQLIDTSFQVVPSAPINIEVTMGFDFDDGFGELDVSGQIAEFVQMVPDPPVTETLEWLTDVITAWDSTEQRLALRGSPRRNINYSFLLEGDAERQRQYNRWFKSLPRRIVLPYYQYGTLLLADAAQGSSTLFLDTSRTDIRDGENVIVYQPWNEVGYLVKVLTVAADRLNLELPLEQDVRRDSIVAPCFTSRLANRSGLSMGPISGSITIDAEALDARPQFTRPGASVTLESRNGYPILVHRPLAESEVDDKFDVNYEVLDNDTGLLDIKTAWPHPFVLGSREFLVQRYYDPASMDWWRAFLDYCRGRQNPFLLPSWRADLVSVAPPGSTSAQLVVASSDYPSRYFPYETYRYVQIENAAGQFLRRRVLSATDLGGGTCRLDLDGAFGSTADELNITKVSFMNLVRLDSDKVTLEHDHHITRIKLSFKAINA